MENKKKFSVIKAMSWYAVGNVLMKGVAFFVLPVFSHLMSTYENGIYTTFNSYSTVLESIILFGLNATIRIAKYDKETNYEDYTSTVLFINFLISGIILVLSNIILLFVPTLFSFDKLLWNILVVSTAFSAGNIVLSGRLTLDGHYKAYFVYLLINTIINLGLSLLLCYTLFSSHDVHMAKIYAIACANICCFIFMFFFLKVKKPNIHYIRRAVSWGSPLIVHTFILSLCGSAATLMLKNMTDYAKTGIYGMATTFMNIPGVLLATFENAWNPWFYDAMHEQDYPKIKRFNNVCYLVYASLIAEFILIVPDVFKIMNIDEAYFNAVYCIAPLSVESYISFIYFTPLNTQYFHKNTKNVMLATLTSAILEFALLYFLIKNFSYYGAGYALLGSKTIMLAFHTYNARKLEKNDLYSQSVLYGTIIGLLIIDIIGSLFVNILVVRLSLFLVIGVLMLFVVLKNKEELLRLFNGG